LLWRVKGAWRDGIRKEAVSLIILDISGIDPLDETIAAAARQAGSSCHRQHRFPFG
jgi:hypothetical protein